MSKLNEPCEPAPYVHDYNPAIRRRMMQFHACLGDCLDKLNFGWAADSKKAIAQLCALKDELDQIINLLKKQEESRS